MKTISLKESHQHTGKHARASAREPLVNIGRGEPVAMLGPPLLSSTKRVLLRAFTLADTVNPARKTESSEAVARGRDER